MKVGLNATALLSPLTGVGQYTYHLAKGLQKFEDLELNMFYANGWSTEVRDKPVKQIRNIKLLLKKFIPKTYEISRIIQQSYFNERSFNKVKGIYHVSGEEMMTPYDIAIRTGRFFKLDESLITATDSTQFKQSARRPLRTGFIIDKAKKDLAYNPHSFEEGLALMKQQLK